MVEDWISQANARQRRGRAGRVKPGNCFCLYTRHRFELLMRPFQVNLFPEKYCSVCIFHLSSYELIVNVTHDTTLVVFSFLCQATRDAADAFGRIVFTD